MIAMLQLFFGPLILTGLTLWAAWLAFAAEADAELPRSLAGPANNDAIAVSRQLHVAHLACLVLAGAAAGTTVVWWAWAPLSGLARLVLAVGVVWVVGDLMPRVVAAVAPELTAPVRRAAVRTLGPFRPLLRL
ncbi:MAG TPA: hypothetical protein VFB89_11035, partial [Gemmatimonadales bacterium]|nr:hypothetical protein [Gemmatimonadales bacterium]